MSMRASILLLGRALVSVVLAIVASVGSLACDASASDRSEPMRKVGVRSDRLMAPRMEFDDVFQAKMLISLEETEEVINVDPTIRLDPEGGFIVADRAEQQIRRYSESGALIWHFGQPGPGPKEFSAPTVAIRDGEGEILAIDSHGKAILWDESERAVERVLSNRLPSVDDADLLDNGKVLYSARISPVETTDFKYALHVLNPRSGNFTDRFFRPKVTEANARAVQVGGWTSSSVLDHRIASVFALSDTVYIFSSRGELQRKIAYPTERFRLISEPWSEEGSFRKWVFRHSFSADVFWISKDALLVQYQDFTHNVPRWHLLGIGIRGEGLFEVRNGPRLHAVSEDGNFYFSHPDSLTANYILLAEARSDVFSR